MSHPSEVDLALHAGGDLTGWRRWRVSRHVRNCAECQEELAFFAQDQSELVESKSRLPEFVNWDRLAAEMQGNIRVGLAAGECVAPRGLARQVKWQHTMGAALAAGLLLAGWALNIPHRSGTFTPLGPTASIRATVPAHPELQATPGGVEIKARSGNTLTLLHDNAQGSAIYTSEPDSLSVRTFNNQTGQIMVHMVSYAE